MTIAVAHPVTSSSNHVLAAGVGEAVARGTDLVVIVVVNSTDGDAAEALEAGVGDLVEGICRAQGLSSVNWRLQIATAASQNVEDVSSAILDCLDSSGASLLVIGARRRSPVGKAFLGSVTQDLILEADVPVLVVKAPRKP